MAESEMRKLAQFIHDLTWDELPEAVREAAAFRTLDLVSVAVGASGDPMAAQIADSFEERCGKGDIPVWGWDRPFPLEQAAMLNAMLAHTLELDDVHPASKTHGSASLIPAAWSLAVHLGKSGREYLTAVVCGYETVNRIGKAFGVSAHRSRGWHATATCGVFGCAAACAKLLDLSEDQIVSALGMAGTQSSGVWAFLGDGCSCKVLHTARAATNGMEAAFLAQAGMTGPEHILDAEDGGLLTAMSDGGHITEVSEGLGETWEILNMDMKPYPCCRSAHCAVDCALELRGKIAEGGKSDLRERTAAAGTSKLRECITAEIANIHIATYLVGYKQCAVSEGCLRPKSVLDAKFSTPYAVAAALLYGRVTMQEFEPEVIADPAVQELIGRITVEPDERFTAEYPRHWGCEMTVTMKDGTVVRSSVMDPSGSVNRPLTRDQVMAKARGFLGVAYAGREDEVIESILRLEDAPEVGFPDTGKSM